jgi:tetratricopeptide (TPR) repeat protein
MAIQIWQPGDKIKNDRFHILKQLGTGGFGITYLAEDTVKKQQIVIKTLNANQQSQPDFAQKQENFLKEGFTLKTFNHPHIVKVHEPIQVGNLWGLVMEYIPGQDLADYIIANGRLGEAEALRYIDQIAQALDCVHQQKFFHRDVKPHNIMLREDRGEAVLIDFGIAKEFVDLETIYLSNSLGTELYKPIEQYEKRGQFGAYTDIYALAVTLYHLLTGAAPGGGSPLYTSKARKDAQDKGWGDKLDEHLWSELANAGVSESTQAAIKAGMEIDPSQRPQSMADFRGLLGLGQKKEIEDKNESGLDSIEYGEEESPITADFPESLVSGKEEEIEDKNKLDLDLVKQGQELLESENYQEAIDSFDRAIEIDPNNADSWSNRGFTLSKLNKYQEAIDSYDRALKIDPDNYNIWHSRGKLLEKMGNDRDLTMGNYIVKSNNRYLTMGNYKEAVNSYDRALKIDPNNLSGWISRGDLLDKMGKYKEAVNSYDRALEIDPNNLSDWISRGDLLGKIDDYKEVANSYIHGLISDPNNLSDWTSRGKLLEKMGNYKEGVNSYDRALKINPNNHNIWHSREKLLEKMGNYQEAIDSYDSALRINPNHRKASSNRQIAIDKLSKPGISLFRKIFS